MFLCFRIVSENIRIRKFKLVFKRDVVNILLSSFPVIEIWQVMSCYTCTNPVTQVLLFIPVAKTAAEWGSKRLNVLPPYSSAIKIKKKKSSFGEKRALINRVYCSCKVA